MAEYRDIAEMLRRATLLNLRLYQSIVDVSLEYVRGLGGLFQTAVPFPGRSESPADGQLILEGAAGTTAQAGFLVSNDLPRDVQLRMLVSAFSHPDGTKVEQEVEFTPPVVALSPGGKQIVAAAVEIGFAFEEGVPYRGEIGIDGMKGFSMPIILRRQHSIQEPGIPRSVDETATARPTRRPARRAAAKHR